MRHTVHEKGDVQSNTKSSIEIDPKRIPQRFVPVIHGNTDGKKNCKDEKQRWIQSETNKFCIACHFSGETYLFCHITIGSCSKSLISTAFRFSTTSGWGVSTSQPTCEKKKPLLALWGSASVSLYLWCTLWSNAQTYTCLYNNNWFGYRLSFCYFFFRLWRVKHNI